MATQFDTESTEVMGLALDPAGGSGRLISSADGASSTIFPQLGWTLSEGPGAWIQKLADGILLRTAPTSYVIVATYTRLTAEAEGDYHFTLRYTADFGNVGFGMMKEDGGGGFRFWGRFGKVSTVGFTVHLKQGENFARGDQLTPIIGIAVLLKELLRRLRVGGTRSPAAEVLDRIGHRLLGLIDVVKTACGAAGR
jgi:hypothetical protein